jgi:serine protease Do
MLKILPTANRRMFRTLAAGLLVASALSSGAILAPSTAVMANTHAVADTSHGFADLVDQVMPAVVSVQVKFTNVAGDGEVGAPAMGSPLENQQRPQGGMALGSGFIISADGYAVTNNHVVQDADEVSVKMTDGTEYKAKVIGTDPKTDLALIKIQSDKTFSFVKFAGKEPRVGDFVMAVGNPFGLGGTVTSGIISAHSRDIGSGPYDDFLQIDASINKGNSGGPAFNVDGDVVGINTAIFSPSGGSVGIGFAIPASTAQSVISSLKETGTVTRGWLGVQVQPVTQDIAESLGVESGKGAIVADVTPDSPALSAGLKTGDTILSVDGKAVQNARDLARHVAMIKPGVSVPVTVVRDGKTMDVEVKIGAMPGEKQAANSPVKDGSDLASFGLKLAPADDGAGVKVMGVDPNGPAAERGIKEGDVILEVAGQEVHGPADVTAAIKDTKKKSVLMLMRSGDAQRFVAMPVGRG